MAPENAESSRDPLALSDSVEPAADSSPLRVSPNTQFESGIPPARQGRTSSSATLLGLELNLEDGVQRMEAALANAVRTEANLALLMRGLKHVAAGADAARTANTELMQELDELRSQLTRSQNEEHAMRLRMSHLEQLLALVRKEMVSEREFLLEEQDRFLREVLDDHERQLNDLRQRLREPNRGQSEADKIAELTAQRDQAREYATRCERERDLAWEELATGVAPPTERMQRSPSAAAAIGAINLRSVAVPASPEKTDEEESPKRSETGYSVSGSDVSDE
ncbi:MAG TPA: hypothetical protein VER96_41720 [Polyangiaceae bacterium]|nr:hypothetical protein [Polyangiaceae bacterium]